jgi:hypothetical protein
MHARVCHCLENDTLTRDTYSQFVESLIKEKLFLSGFDSSHGPVDVGVIPLRTHTEPPL